MNADTACMRSARHIGERSSCVSLADQLADEGSDQLHFRKST